MLEPTIQIDLPHGASGSVAFYGNGHSQVVNLVHDLRDGFEVSAFCHKCEQPMNTGRWVGSEDLPLDRRGTWRHGCGGRARMPDGYEIHDRRTGRVLDGYVQARDQITLSAITLAELLRLSQAARAVREGRPGADERLEQVLRKAPAPLRDLPSRWPRADRLQLAAIIISIVALLMPLLKDDGGVTPQQLLDLVEQVVEQEESGRGEDQSPGGEAGDSADQPGAGEGPGPVESGGHKGPRLTDAPDDQRSVADAHEE